MERQVSTVRGSKSYQDALSVDVSVEAGYSGAVWGARFSASTSYKEVNEGTSRHRRIYTRAIAKCSEYDLNVNYQYAQVGVHGDFERAVNALPLTEDNDKYDKFINAYGTHFTTRVTLGAKMIVRSEFEEEAWSKMKEKGVKVAVAAQLSYGLASVGVSTGVETQNNEKEEFEKARRDKSESYVGSRPPSDGRWETWAEMAADSPYPIAYTLVSMTSILSEKFFPNMPVNDLTTRRDLLTEAYDTYCSRLEGCESETSTCYIPYRKNCIQCI